LLWFQSPHCLRQCRWGTSRPPVVFLDCVANSTSSVMDWWRVSTGTGWVVKCCRLHGEWVIEEHDLCVLALTLLIIDFLFSVQMVGEFLCPFDSASECIGGTMEPEASGRCKGKGCCRHCTIHFTVPYISLYHTFLRLHHIPFALI
jgi:hypothetical protein